MRHDIPWREIEQLVRDRKSYRGISRAMAERGVKISHVAIGRHCTKLGLNSPVKNWLPDAQQSDTAKRIGNPQTRSDHQIARGRRTPERMARYLELTEMGANHRASCAPICMDDDTAKAWIDDDQSFADLISEAESRYIEGPFRAINNAVERGDWGAAKWVIGHHPLTKADYGDADKGRGDKKIQIEINIPAPGTVDAKPIATTVIDMPADYETDDEGAAW